MKLWLNKSTEVPMQEQLATQIVLGIVSDDLSPGERLPSSAQLARRFRVHPNTVRLAYRKLAFDGWIEFKRGNGFFVRGRSHEEHSRENGDRDQLIAAFFDAARRLGISTRTLRLRFKRWLAVKPPNQIVVIEPDPGLRRILVAEIQDTVNSRVRGVGPAPHNRRQFKGALFVALPERKARTRGSAPIEGPCVYLKSNSIPRALGQEHPPPPDMVISVISVWPGFLDRARTTLAAVGIDPALIDLRRGELSDAKRRLASGNLVITDSLIGRRLPPHPLLRVFPIIANESLAELRDGFRNTKTRGSVT